ncbi:MAG: GntR family transcriptional regulator [Caulobacter sp.]|nr:GntR family transcriptional regulator [Caulobacter sp.]
MARNQVLSRTATSSPKTPPAPIRGVFETQKGWMLQDAVAVLRRLILSGELPPGERLREVAISERLGMSRTPIREAFRTLAAEGLVDLLPNRSVMVSEVNSADAPDVFAVLGALESLAAQFACARMSDEQVAVLVELQTTLERQFEMAERVGYTETNQLIHELIVEGSNNAALTMAWRMILPRAQRVRTLNNLDRRRWAEAVNEHRQITDALVARDAARLGSLMQLHFDNGVDSMVRRKTGRSGKAGPAAVGVID